MKFFPMICEQEKAVYFAAFIAISGFGFSQGYRIAATFLLASEGSSLRIGSHRLLRRL